jgi:hypothetical protein
MLLGLAIAGVGLALAVAAWAQARAGRLSTGHGAAWAVSGVVLAAGGLGLGLLGPRGRAGGAAALLLAVVVLLIVALAHAVALTRLSERVKLLAQEVALLRRTGDGPAAADAGTDAPRRAD